jgi:hypothetical protein
MHRAVMPRSHARIVPRLALCVNRLERERGVRGPRSEPMPIEMRLRRLSRPRWFKERSWGQRCGHAGRGIYCKAGMAGRNYQEREAHASGQC